MDWFGPFVETTVNDWIRGRSMSKSGSFQERLEEALRNLEMSRPERKGRTRRRFDRQKTWCVMSHSCSLAR